MVGTVEFGPLAVGSKSERASAAYLRTDDGRRLVLRRLGGNPFHDPKIEAAKGKRIAAEGILHGHTFLLEEFRVLGEEAK